MMKIFRKVIEKCRRKSRLKKVKKFLSNQDNVIILHRQNEMVHQLRREKGNWIEEINYPKSKIKICKSIETTRDDRKIEELLNLYSTAANKQI